MVHTEAKVSAAATRETLTYVASRPQVIEAIELQDADSAATLTILVAPKGSDTLGCVLEQGAGGVGGQIYWSGCLTLSPDEEIRGYVDGSTAADRLYLTVKIR